MFCSQALYTINLTEFMGI